MKLLKNISKKIIMIIIMISILITFISTPLSYAELDLKEGDFYYSGTTKGTYTIKKGIFEWLLDAIGQIADWLLGIMTLGIRMVFVGWTALIEKLLTWTLESASGVNASGSIVENSNDFTNLNNSANNLTVEAIVFNRVEALNANIFKTDVDRTVSGTGQKLVCEKCKKNVDECVTNLPQKINLNKIKVSDICSCGCNGCDSCITYVKQMAVDDPVIVKIRQTVSAWYQIILLLAVAIMLVVLIAVGIKMAVSTIASDKALYNRMLFDWLVGTIMIFTLNYFMVFAINANEMLLNTIEHFSNVNNTNKVKMMQLTNSNSQFTNSEIELKVYEEVRTRAYDPKLLNGVIGMIMYMTLVYFAFRFTIIYLKRLLTIIVLTLMAPGVGVAYALQKVISGKSQALQTWMKEYIMNLLIQVVHALLYAVFITEALVLSLQSISGIIVAFILMNYTMKADKLFKKIFNFGGSDSLVGHTENAQEELKDNLKTARGIAIGAAPAAKILTNTPYAKTLKATGKLAAATAVLGARAFRDGIVRFNPNGESPSDSDRYENAVEDEMNQNGGYEKQENESQEDYDQRRAEAEEKVSGESPEFYDQNVLNAGGQKLNDELKFAKEQMSEENLQGKSDEEKEEAQNRYIDALRKYNRYKQLITPTNFQIAKGHLNRLLDMEDVFSSTTSKNPLKLAKIGVFGTTHWDKNNWRFTNDGNGIYKQLSASNLLGLTDKDKKYLKALTRDMKNTLLGMGSMFLGMGTLVANPTMGMSLLAGGFAATRKTLGKRPNSSGKYKFSRFAPQSIRAIRNSALVRAKHERDALRVAKLQRKYPNFTRKLRNGAVSAVTIGTLGGTLQILTGAALTGGILPSMALVGASGYMATKLMRNRAIGQTLDEIDMYASKQQEQQMEEFYAESDKQENVSLNAMNQVIIYEQMRKDKETDKMVEAQLYEDLGFEVDNKTGELTRKEKIDDNEELNSEVDSYVLTDGDIKFVHKEIDNIVLELSKGKEIDMSSKKVQNDAMDMLTGSLKAQGILEGSQKADILFKAGKSGLTRELKAKAQSNNLKVKRAKKKLDDLSAKEAEMVVNTVSELLKESRENKKDFSAITADDVIARMNSKGSSNSSKSNKSKRNKNQSSNNNDKKEAITNYLKIIKKPVKVKRKKGKVSDKTAKNVKRQVNKNLEKSKQERAQKRQQALELYLGNDATNNDLLNKLFAQMDEDSVKTVKKVANNTRKKMNINQEAINRKTGNIKYGTDAFLMAEKKRSELTLELLNLQKQKIEIDSGLRTDKTLDEINEEISKKKKQVDIAQDEVNKKGPVDDINEYIKLETFLGNYKK